MKRALWVILCVLLGSVRLPAGAAEVSAASAVLYLPQREQFLFEKQADTVRPMASTTKLMTALLLAEAMPAAQTVTVPAGALPAEGSSMGLKAGDTLSVQALCAGMLLASGNDAANAAALLLDNSFPAFADRMNRRAAALGMDNTVFVTPSGLDEGAHGATARDMARLGAAVLQVPLLRELCATRNMTVTVSGETVWLYPACIGLKTGFTRQAGRCLVSAAEQDGVTLVAVTLRAPDDWNDHIRLYQEGFARTRTVDCPAPPPRQIPVIGGEQGCVAVAADAGAPLVLLDEERLSTRICLPGVLFAPVRQGQTLGVMQVFADRQLLCELPLQARDAVPARPSASFWRRLRQTWLQLLRDMVAL